MRRVTKLDQQVVMGGLGGFSPVALTPDAPTLIESGKQALAVGDVATATQQFSRCIEAFPEAGEAYFRLASIEIDGKNYQRARELLEKAHSLAPDRPSVLYLLGLAHFHLHQPFDAIPYLERALEIEPADYQARMLLANVCLRAGQREEGSAWLDSLDGRQIVDRNDKMLLSEMYFTYGQRKKAEEVLLDLADGPIPSAEAVLALSWLAPENASLDLRSAIDRGLANPDNSALDKSRLYSAAANIAEAAGKFDEAFDHFRKSNALCVEAHGLPNPPFDLPRYDETISRLMTAFDKLAPTSRVSGEKAVFIVGMPRSGKSLLESGLSDLASVAAAGEVTLSHFVSPDLLVAPDGSLCSAFENQLALLHGETLEKAARPYLDFLDRFGASRVVNTLPPNFNNVGLIRLLWPRASIIDVRRDPLDNCLTCYSTLFRAHFYTCDLGLLGGYYRRYRDLMDHWDNIGAGVLRVTFEDMLDDRAAETSRALEHIGLSSERSDNAGADTYEGRPLDRSRIGHARNYARHLKELAELLA